MVFAISLQTLGADWVWWFCRCALSPSDVEIVGWTATRKSTGAMPADGQA